MINNIIGSYKIVKKLGEGGMGAVYLANHVNIGTKVAIKVLHKHLIANNTIRTRFLKEAKMQAILDHPNITKVIDFIDNEDGLFIILEYVKGEELNDYLFKNKGLMPEQEANHYMSKILDAVAYAHSKGIIHRDLKSANIMITPNHNIKIMDFGIAKLAGESLSLTKTGSRIGSPLYMSPEQVTSGAIDFRSDIYSLGVVYHEMLTGKPVYNQNNTTEYEIYDKIVRQPLPRLKTFYPMISEKAQEIVDRATSKLPQARFQSCEEFKQALQNDVIPLPEKPQEIPHTKKTNNTFKIIGLLFLIVILGVGIWFVLNKNTNSLINNTAKGTLEAEKFIAEKDYKKAFAAYQELLKNDKNNTTLQQKITDLKEKSNSYKSKKVKEILFNHLQTNNLDTIKNTDTLFYKKLEANYNNILNSFNELKKDSQIIDTTQTALLSKVKSLKTQLTSTQKEPKITGETIPFDFVEVVPSFKGCNYNNNQAQKRCFDKKIKKYITTNINTKLYNSLGLSNGKHTVKYLFVIDKNGKIANIKVNAPNEIIAQDVTNVLQTINSFKAGKDKNKNVAVTYASSFDFKIGKTPTQENRQNNENKGNEEEIIETNMPSSVSFQEAKRAPIYPGCENTPSAIMFTCTSKKILDYIKNNINYDNINEGKAINEKAIIRFSIDTNGIPTNIKIKTNKESIKREIIKVINTLPKMQPAIYDNDLSIKSNFYGTLNIKIAFEDAK